MLLLILAIAPVVIIAFYVYFRDKYEKEPVSLLLLSLLSGVLIVIPVLILDFLLDRAFSGIPASYIPAYRAFISAGLVEEFFKFLAVYLLIWKNRNFNERFDGIVYAVFVSLGFALVENILYIEQSGLHTALLRSITAVPMHAIVGVIMGFYFGLARFMPQHRKILLFRALMMAVLFHGIYDYFLFSQKTLLLSLWIPYFIYLWVSGLRKMKILLKADHLQIVEKDNINE